MEPFIHLHVHTQYSLLDGQASIDALIDKAQKDGMNAIAVTDHGNKGVLQQGLQEERETAWSHQRPGKRTESPQRERSSFHRRAGTPAGDSVSDRSRKEKDIQTDYRLRVLLRPQRKA